MEEYDTSYQSALHHACGHSSWSWRIYKAAFVLARDGPAAVINAWSTGYALYYTPLMFVCDASGKYASERCRIANMLIDRRADIEAVDQLGNTPFLLASSAGFILMLELLYAVGACIHAVNYAGAGARSRCKQSSGTTAAYLEALNAGSAERKYPPDAVRGTRQGQSQNVRIQRFNAHQRTMHGLDNRVYV